MERFKQAYLMELEYFAPHLQNKEIVSIFFGGGTPSLMPPSIAEAIIDKAAALGILSADVEITLEANPTSVEASTFKDFKAAGINRVSMGVQSLNDEDLRFLGREHSVHEALKAVDSARSIFDRYSFDLMYARPGQKLTDWEKELKSALPYIGRHASLYQLTIEKGTPFYSAYHHGGFTLPDENHAADLYDLTGDIMANSGLLAYEVSNYAIPGQECRHNLIYWNYGEYLGIGAGAHSRLHTAEGVKALMTIHHPENWLQSVENKEHGIQSQEMLGHNEVLEEVLLMGLRLSDGLSISCFEGILGKSPADMLAQKPMQALCEEGLLLVNSTHIKATKRGRMVLNRLVSALIEV